jgi:hypothetical protein
MVTTWPPSNLEILDCQDNLISLAFRNTEAMRHQVGSEKESAPAGGIAYRITGHLSDLNTIESKMARASLVSSGSIDSWGWPIVITARSPFRSTTR